MIRPQKFPGVVPTIRPLIRGLKRLPAAVPQFVCNTGKGFLHGGFSLPQDLFLHGNGIAHCLPLSGFLNGPLRALLLGLCVRLCGGGTCVCALLYSLLCGLCGSQIVAVCIWADNAAHRAGRRAYQKVIQRVGKRFLRRGHVTAVNAGQLPFHPVANKLFQAFTNCSGSEGQRRSQRLFTNFCFGKLVYRAADSTFHHIIQRAAAVCFCKRQCNVEHFFGENLFRGRCCAVKALLPPRSAVLPCLLGRSAEGPRRKRDHARCAAGNEIGNCVKGALGHRCPRVHQQPPNSPRTLFCTGQVFFCIGCNFICQPVIFLCGCVGFGGCFPSVLNIPAHPVDF